MEQIAEEGIDFQLFGVPHHCHKAYIICIDYLLVTADHALRQRLRMEHICWGFFLHGHFGSSFTFKDIGTSFHALL